MKNKKLSKWFAALLVVAMLISCMSISALAAADTPSLNLGEKGSISVTLTDVKDGTLTLYEVAELGFDDGNMAYTKTDAFSGFSGDLDVEDASLAGSLAEYVSDNHVSGTAQTISFGGEVSFTDLTLGLYLIVQTEQSTGFYTIDPFLVTVPIAENDEWVYNVDASPKTEVNPSPDTTPSPTPTSSETPEPDSSPTPSTTTTNGGGTPGTTSGNGGNGGGSGTTSTGTGNNLPQTGQLNWPVALFAALGVIFVVVGIVLVNTGRKKHSET